MARPDPPCRTYIVYHHGLFAQGVRSILEDGRAVKIVGMECDLTKALKAVHSLHPEVIIVEESTGKHQPMRLGAFLHSAGSGRVVTLSLEHAFATVFQRSRVVATGPADLVMAIKGASQKQLPRPYQPRAKASMHSQPGTGLIGDEGRSGEKSRVPHTRKSEAKAAVNIPRAPRGGQKRRG
jgi:DNA-binding NarL/FixJ family response regulator